MPRNWRRRGPVAAFRRRARDYERWATMFYNNVLRSTPYSYINLVQRQRQQIMVYAMRERHRMGLDGSRAYWRHVRDVAGRQMRFRALYLRRLQEEDQAPYPHQYIDSPLDYSWYQEQFD